MGRLFGLAFLPCSTLIPKCTRSFGPRGLPGHDNKKVVADGCKRSMMEPTANRPFAWVLFVAVRIVPLNPWPTHGGNLDTAARPTRSCYYYRDFRGINGWPRARIGRGLVKSQKVVIPWLMQLLVSWPAKNHFDLCWVLEAGRFVSCQFI